METVSVSTSQHVNIDYPVAGLGERVAARLIDLGLFLVVFLIFLFFFGLTGLINSGSLAITVMLLIYGAGFVFYDLICEIFMNGQSIGKRWLKIKVISLDGSQATLGQYFIRWVFRIVDFTLTSWIGALVCVAVTENKQRIGDIVAGTTLIKTIPRTQLEHIAFHPNEETYTPVFDNVAQLSDRDIELIHEVIGAFYKTRNSALVYQMAEKVTAHLHISIPSGMNELEFLKTVVMDYNQLTAKI